MDKKKVGVISLGCDKNRVDTEKMLAVLGERYEITPRAEDADIIVVNTCAFLASARKEAIEEALAVAELKKSGKLEKLVMTGCLPQKFVRDMFDEFKEVDVFLGVADYDRLPEAIDLAYTGKRVDFVGTVKGETLTRRMLSTDGYAYLKIADGCSNHCTYCLIPAIRGPYRSYSPDALVAEAAGLGKVNELILVAQDITKYGSDKPEYGDLASLLRRLAALDNVLHLRLLYCYPENIDDALIDTIAAEPKILKYIDMPLQHADDGVLRRMNRKGTYAGYVALIEKLRTRIPGVALRSTFIAGFPGESEEEFAVLEKFLREVRLDNAGFFAYSREEGTPAYRMKGQIGAKVKEARRAALYELQRKISREINESAVGKTVQVFVDGFDGETYRGRTYKQAPDADGAVLFGGKVHNVGDVADVRITRADDYDLFGEEL